MKLMIWLEREQLDEEFWFAPGEAALINNLTIHHHAKMTQEMNLQRGRCCRLFLSGSSHLIDSTVSSVVRHTSVCRETPERANVHDNDKLKCVGHGKQECDVGSVPFVTDTKE